MALKIEQVGNFNVFSWDAFKCPICKCNNFTSLDHTSVWCDNCNAKFQTRYTGGDPGLVVDCWIASEERAYVYAPSYQCEDCKMTRGFFDEQPKTCVCGSTKEMVRREGMSQPWNPPEGFGKRWCLVLKLGDYCSGWSNVDDGKGFRKATDANYPTQEEWDAYQDQLHNERELERAISEVIGF
jgi:hypothetical protein